MKLLISLILCVSTCIASSQVTKSFPEAVKLFDDGSEELLLVKSLEEFTELEQNCLVKFISLSNSLFRDEQFIEAMSSKKSLVIYLQDFLKQPSSEMKIEQKLLLLELYVVFEVDHCSSLECPHKKSWNDYIKKLSASVRLRRSSYECGTLIKEVLSSSVSLDAWYSLVPVRFNFLKRSKGGLFSYKKLFEEVSVLHEFGLSLNDTIFIASWVEVLTDNYQFSESDKKLLAAARKGDVDKVARYANESLTVLQDLALFLSLCFKQDACALVLATDFPSERVATLEEFYYRIPLLSLQIQRAVCQNSPVAQLLSSRLRNISGPDEITVIKQGLLGGLMSSCFFLVETREAFELVLSNKVFDNDPSELLRKWLLTCFDKDCEGIKAMQWYKPDNQMHLFSLRLVLSRLVHKGQLEVIKQLSLFGCARELLVFDDYYKQLAQECSQDAILLYLKGLTF